MYSKPYLFQLVQKFPFYVMRSSLDIELGARVETLTKFYVFFINKISRQNDLGLAEVEQFLHFKKFIEQLNSKNVSLQKLLK